MALNVLMNLEMIKFVDNKIYKVKNKEEKIEKNLENQLCEEKYVNSQDKESKDIGKISKNKVIMNKTMNFEITQIEKYKRIRSFSVIN